MRFFFVSAALLGVALAQEPCAQVASSLAQTPGAVSGALAMKCLQSVPVDTKGDIAQLDGMLTFNNFQSTLAYLKNPPPGYMYPAVDFLGGLQNIQSKVKSNGYDSEYDVQNAISELYFSAHDGHLYYYADITSLFLFGYLLDIISVSTDGVSVAEVYGAVDGPVLAGLASGYKPSPITKMNGQDTGTFLEKFANAASADQDPDAAFNTIFGIIPDQVTGAGVPTWEQSAVYLGSSVTLTFGNGSTLELETIAFTEADFSGVTNGATFFEKFCTGGSASSSAAAPSGTLPPSASAASASSFVRSSFLPSSSFGFPSASEASFSSSAFIAKRSASASSSFFFGSATSVQPSGTFVPSGSAAGSASGSGYIPDMTTQVSYTPVPSQTTFPGLISYPKPWAIASDESIACYYPEENSDLAVLSCPNFGPASTTDFSDVIRECLATAKKLGKKKLIIDTRGNPGGDVLSGYDFFKQLFPSKEPWGTSNWRAWKLFDQLGEIVTSHFADVTAATAGKAGYQNAFSTIFNAKQQLNASYEPFTSWDAFYGPESIHGDTFTHLTRWNLSDPYQLQGQQISGYGGLSDIVPVQTFASDDILLVQDGNCASTCTVFGEFMKTQGGVGSVVFGGRLQTGPMQAIGGTKGANDYSINTILVEAQLSLDVAPESKVKAITSEYQTGIVGVQQALKRATGSTSDKAFSVNVRNNIRKGDETFTPLQFVYEAADCRLFYTAAQRFNQALVWKAAYASYWSGASCVSGSTGQLSSKPGTGYILASPGAKQAPSTPKSAVVSSTSNPAMPMATAAMAALVPVFAAGAMIW